MIEPPVMGMCIHQNVYEKNDDKASLTQLRPSLKSLELRHVPLCNLHNLQLTLLVSCDSFAFLPDGFAFFHQIFMMDHGLVVLH